VKESIKDRTRW